MLGPWCVFLGGEETRGWMGVGWGWGVPKVSCYLLFPSFLYLHPPPPRSQYIDYKMPLMTLSAVNKCRRPSSLEEMDGRAGMVMVVVVAVMWWWREGGGGGGSGIIYTHAPVPNPVTSVWTGWDR